MALTAELAAITDDYYKKNKVEDLYFRASVMLYRLLGNGQNEVNLVNGNDTVDGGKKLVEFLEYQGSQADTYGSGTTISSTKKEVFNAAAFSWSGYNSSNTIDLDDIVQNGDSDRALVKLVQGKLDNIGKTVRDTMNAGLFVARSASTGTYGFDGFPDLFNTTDSVAYGNITEADMPSWAANVVASPGAISYSVLQELFATASVGQTADAHPDLIVTTRTLMDAYAAKLQIQQRFVQDKDMAEAGFKHTLHDGVVLSFDEKTPAGEIYCLNTKRMSIKTHEKYNFTTPKWIPFSESKPDLLTANCRWVGALTTSDRGSHVKATNVTAV